MRRGVLALARPFVIMSRILGVVVGLIGLFLLAAGLSSFFGSRAFSDGVTVDGEVVDSVVSTIGSDGDNPRIRYRDVVAYEVDGTSYEITADSSQSEPSPIGSTVDVSYRSSDPAAGRIIGSSSGLILALVGLAITLLGFLLFFGGPRYARTVRRYQSERL